MRFGIVSLFADELLGFLGIGVVGRAMANGRISVVGANPRDHAEDRHRRVDDRPFGGGPGMVMTPGPLIGAIDTLRERLPAGPVVCLSPQGRRLDQRRVDGWAAGGELILVCGRYEGIDQRVIDLAVDEEVSLGDFVLSGGEIAAAAVVDAVARRVDGVLGHPASADDDSFATDGLLDWPHYSRPDRFAGHDVPAVLRSGDHAAIARWRRERALQLTAERRPDLLEGADLSSDDRKFLNRLANRAGPQHASSGT